MKGKREAPRGKSNLFSIVSGIALATAIIFIPTPVEGEDKNIELPSFPYSTAIREEAKKYTARPIRPVEKPFVPRYSDEEVEIIAKTVYGEALVTHSDREMSAVVWCILNRANDPRYPDTIAEVVTANQFNGYDKNNPVDPHIEILTRDVLNRWSDELDGVADVGRTLPSDYLYFTGDGRHNHFTVNGNKATVWDWSYPNPYDN